LVQPSTTSTVHQHLVAITASPTIGVTYRIVRTPELCGRGRQFRPNLFNAAEYSFLIHGAGNGNNFTLHPDYEGR
jgi:hypothetical protein